MCPADIIVELGTDIPVTNATATGGCTTPSISFMDNITGPTRALLLHEKKSKHSWATRSPVNVTVDEPITATGNGTSFVAQILGPLVPFTANMTVTNSTQQARAMRDFRSPAPMPNVAQTHSAQILESGQGFSPPDPTLDASSNWVVTMTNWGGGSRLVIYSAADLTLQGSFILNTEAVSGDCATNGAGDPQLLYDEVADRWVVLEFTAGLNDLCIYATDSNNPLTANWMLYQIMTPTFPDYPKFGVFGDLYTVTTNENDMSGATPAIYFIERQPIVTGAMTTRWFRVTRPPLDGFGFQAYAPVTVEGGPQPGAGIHENGALFMRHNDDESHSFTPVGGQDFVEVAHYKNVNFDMSTASLTTYSIPVPEFDSDLCGLGGTSCVVHPGDTPLDPLREVIMDRLVYRSIPGKSQQSIVATWATNVGADRPGIFWAEFRPSGMGSMWSLFQSNIYSPSGDVARWMPSAAMDSQGTVCMIYSVASAMKEPSLRVTTRLANDAAGMLRNELEVAAGGAPAVDGSSRWGDYFGMATDPSQPRIFFAIGEFSPPGSGVWQVHVSRLRISGDVIERTFTAEDTCMDSDSCIQTITVQ